MQQTSMQKEIINHDKIKGGFNMFKTMKKRIKNEKGLTLIELLAVIVILAIVAAIAIPAIGNIISNSQVKAIKADAANIISAANLYYTEEGSTAATFTQATSGDYIADSGNFKEYSVSNDLKFTGTATNGNVKVVINAAELSQIDIDSPDSVTDGDPDYVIVTK